MRIRSILPLLPAALLILLVSGVALAKTILGSLGLWSDLGSGQGSLLGFHMISKSIGSALGLSLILASVSTTLAALLGLGVAYLIHASSRWSKTLAVVIGCLVITPHLVAAVSFNLLLGDAGFLARFLHPFTTNWPQFVAGPLWLAVILDFAWKESAFIALVILASLPREVQDLRLLAATLGAKPNQIALKVLLPSIKPALIVSSGLAFIYSIGSYEATWILGRTFPEPLANLTFRLFSNSDLSQRPAAYASAVLSLIVIACFAGAMAFFFSKKVNR